jgi:hypothetical protein
MEENGVVCGLRVAFGPTTLILAGYSAGVDGNLDLSRNLREV